MTINEAEQQYSLEVANCIEQHKKQIQKAKTISIIIDFCLILIGIVLTIVGYTTPPEVTSWGYESESSAAIFEKIFGITSLVIGAVILLIIIPSLNKAQRKGPQNFLPQIKNLYFNYLKCEDMSDEDKDFYKQKLEDIRNMELVDAINRASTAASAAIMFNALHK